MTYLTYSSSLLGEHRASTALLHRTRFGAILFSCAHVHPAAFISSSTLLLQVCLGHPTLLFPWGFHSSACLVVFAADLRRVCPIHPHFLFLISLLIGAWCDLSHRLVFVIFSGHLMFKIHRRHLLTKLWRLFAMVFVVRHVSDP